MFADGFHQALLSNCSKFPKIAAKVAMFILEKVPAVKSKFSDKEVEILSKLAVDIIAGFKETGLGNTSSIR